MFERGLLLCQRPYACLRCSPQCPAFLNLLHFHLSPISLTSSDPLLLPSMCKLSEIPGLWRLGPQSRGLCDSRHQLFMASRTPIQSIPMIPATNLKCHVDLRDTDPKCPYDQGHHFQVTGVCPKPLTRCNNSPPHLPNQTSPGGSSAYK